MPAFEVAVLAILREDIQAVRGEVLRSLREQRTQLQESGLAASSFWKGAVQELSERAVGSVADLVWTTILAVGRALPQTSNKERQNVAIRVFREEMQWVEDTANKALGSSIGSVDKVGLSARRQSAEHALAAKVQMMDTSTQPDNPVRSQPLDPRMVWVVSGRNSKARSAMFQLLRSLDLAPVEWNDAVAGTGQGAPFIGDVIQGLAKAQAIIVLLTGDEYVQLHSDLATPDDPPSETSPQLQPRPNVVFEAGMALGNPDTRDRTILVQVGKAKSFSDVAGRHAIKMSNSPQPRTDLANRLRAAGCPAKTSGHDWLEVGDFESTTLEETQGQGVTNLAGIELVPEGLALQVMGVIGLAAEGNSEGISAGGVAQGLRLPVLRVEYELDRLAEAGYVRRKVFWQKPPTYQLTPKGRSVYVKARWA